VATYPIELRLAGRVVLVVGGGRVAARKVAGLVEAGATVHVVSPAFCAELLERQDIKIDERPYGPECLAGAWLVFACTDDRRVNEAVVSAARAQGIWCNVADEPEACDFFVPAMLRRGELTLAVGTGGAAPGAAAALRDKLASHLTEEWGILVEELGRARRILKARVPEAGLRRQILETLCSECSIKLLAVRDREAWRRWFERVTEYRLQGLEDVPEVM
jgi:precorrin-2 dehydrogenase / sirohydrochlorin ferrochelatase